MVPRMILETILESNHSRLKLFFGLRFSSDEMGDSGLESGGILRLACFGSSWYRGLVENNDLLIEINFLM